MDQRRAFGLRRSPPFTRQTRSTTSNKIDFTMPSLRSRPPLSPDALLKECQEIERQLGKTILIPKGPRTIDLDLLFYHDQILNAPGLQIPHPAISNRAFVLVPLTEIAPDFIHPALHTSVTETLRRLNVETSRRDVSTKIERIAAPGWEKIPLVSNGPS
ncbi:MAG: 2-amino-4-hydroxy-6-hydroxymethyldihydropteridine diphosphokinase [Candidatus Manganitrophus sp.]|nr:MAG: 2-amino-4-hydroxy-6-hydroxymethyldihydropteridine diphosphokinase [Candidatus Manganitrophus sp.]